MTAEESDRRVDELAKLLIGGKRTSELLLFCAENYGVQKRQAAVYLAKAREQLKADMSINRQDFIAAKLALLDEVQQKSLKSNQMGSVIGSIRLQAELAQILG
ncbi:hypothetical protein MY494_09185 [Synechococcus sp. A10-1-5-1]|uniref:hypothetical protein n=1 Tax=Synechococcus sp. A10-1-5-1 TaxID=2936507 RepID=UPI0020005C15|nr:hypothetical protein [Synechococcus sp. A10-1-5-1]UPM49510.1 hypothetical protein MY494_09185 [Synechococcus sp. A10-1-5-1]